MLNKIIVPYNKENIHFVINFLWVIPSILLFILLKIHQSNAISSSLLLYIVQATLIFLILIFLIAYISAFHYLRSNKPLAVLGDEGIWINHYNFIAWQDIEDVNSYTIPGTPMQVVGVRVKNSNAVSKQASLAGKIGIFWARLFGYHYQITLSNMAMDNEQIIVFAKRYLN